MVFKKKNPPPPPPPPPRKEKFWACLWNETLSPPRFLPSLVNSSLFTSKYIPQRLLRYNKSLNEGSRLIPLCNSEYNYTSATFKQIFYF